MLDLSKNVNENVEVIATRIKSKKAFTMFIINLALCLFIFLVAILGIVLLSDKNNQFIKIFNYILFGIGGILTLNSIYSLIYLIKHNKRLNPCLLYDKSRKVLIASTVFDKQIEFPITNLVVIKKDFVFSDNKIIIDYRKSNGKADRIAIGWCDNFENIVKSVDKYRDGI